MIQTIYLIIFIYFLVGGIGIYFINRNKDFQEARKSYTKFITYFFIINILFFSITINPVIFRILSAFIIAAGFFELFRLYHKDKYKHTRFFLLALTVFSIFSIGFFLFSGLNKELILYSFLILSIFDSFSQITGQLWGSTKIFPNISPGKTTEGLGGGTIVAILSGLLLQKLTAGSSIEALFLATGVVIFAFAGDISASFYKRKYNVKDYSNLIPGHGGFLDRFDSLIAGGGWVAFYIYVLNF